MKKLLHTNIGSSPSNPHQLLHTFDSESSIMRHRDSYHIVFKSQDTQSHHYYHGINSYFCNYRVLLYHYSTKSLWTSDDTIGDKFYCIL